MNPYHEFRSEFSNQPFTYKKPDGTELRCHEISICIAPKEDATSTLAFAWDVFKKLAGWVVEEFKDSPPDETYRITVAWSKTVREQQGHMLKVWCSLSDVRKIVDCKSMEDCSAYFGSGWIPLSNWQKDVFKPV